MSLAAEPGGRAGRPRCLPVPPEDLSSGQQGRGAAPSGGGGRRSRPGGTLRIPRGDLGALGGVEGAGNDAAASNFSLWERFFFLVWT